jgi:hypothetical protein
MGINYTGYMHKDLRLLMYLAAARDHSVVVHTRPGWQLAVVVPADGFGESADRCAVYRSIHGAIDIATAYELLGAD